MHRHAREHSFRHVVRHVAMKKPRARIVRNHVSDLHRRGQQIHDVRAPATFLGHTQAMPMRGVKIPFRAEAKKIPAHALALVHFQPGRLPKM